MEINKSILKNILNNDYNDYQKLIFKIFKKFKIDNEKDNKTYNEVCYPKSFNHTKPQLFLSNYVKNMPTNGILLIHGIGSGKTCSAIMIAESIKKTKKIMIVSPASLIGNMVFELLSKCCGNEYITEEDRNEIKKLSPKSKEYKEIYNKALKKINKFYTIISFNKFVQLSQKNKIKLNDTLLIIDEVQNLLNENGTFYQSFKKEIDKSNSCKVVAMSGTPLVNHPKDIALIINLLKPINPFNLDTFDETFLKKNDDNVNNSFEIYDMKNVELFREMINGYVSYFKGSPPKYYPKKIVKIVECPMSKYQYSMYQIVMNKENTTAITTGDIFKMNNDFYIGSRMISNMSFEKKLIGLKGYNTISKKTLNNIKTYSCKFDKLLKSIKKCKGKVFIYSNFREYGGIQSLIKLLELSGYKNYVDNDVGTNRFAIWSGDESQTLKSKIREVYNNVNNIDGSKIKIILGSPSIKEGVTLLAVKECHIIDYYWNMSRIEQIVGRVVRYCSHRQVPTNERQVKIFFYVATAPKTKTKNNKNREQTIDQKIMEIAYYKMNVLSQFMKELKKCAIDKLLFQ